MGQGCHSSGSFQLGTGNGFLLHLSQGSGTAACADTQSCLWAHITDTRAAWRNLDLHTPLVMCENGQKLYPPSRTLNKPLTDCAQVESSDFDTVVVKCELTEPELLQEPQLPPSTPPAHSLLLQPQPALLIWTTAARSSNRYPAVVHLPRSGTKQITTKLSWILK